MSAEGDQLVARQNCLQPLLALDKRLLAQVHRVLEHEIESAIQQLRFMAQRVLKQLEMRDAVFSDRDEFAVDHGVALDALQCFGDLDIAVTDDLAVAAVERNLAPPDFSDHPKAVVLVLENPAGGRQTARRWASQASAAGAWAGSTSGSFEANSLRARCEMHGRPSRMRNGRGRRHVP